LIAWDVYLDLVRGGETVDVLALVVADIGATCLGSSFGAGLSSKESHSISAWPSSSVRSTSKLRIQL
jgi:hypothetical protein